jgi:hypothetical protein
VPGASARFGESEASRAGRARPPPQGGIAAQALERAAAGAPGLAPERLGCVHPRGEPRLGELAGERGVASHFAGAGAGRMLPRSPERVGAPDGSPLPMSHRPGATFRRGPRHRARLRAPSEAERNEKAAREAAQAEDPEAVHRDGFAVGTDHDPLEGIAGRRGEAGAPARGRGQASRGRRRPRLPPAGGAALPRSPPRPGPEPGARAEDPPRLDPAGVFYSGRAT